SVVDNHSGDAVYTSATPVNPLAVKPPVQLALSVPAIRSPGVNGTAWRTDLTMTNAGLAPLFLGVRLEPDGPVRGIPVAIGESVRLDDVLGTQFGLASGFAVL